MKRLAIAVLLLLSLLQPAVAQKPQEEDTTADPGEKHAPMEVYYNKDFREEPWQQQDGNARVAGEAAIVVAANVVLYVVFRRWQRSA